MAKCVEAAPRNPKGVQDRPQVVLHDFVGGWWSVISRDKKEVSNLTIRALAPSSFGPHARFSLNYHVGPWVS